MVKLHWLLRTAQEVGLIAPDTLSYDARAPTPEVWEKLLATVHLSSDDVVARIATGIGVSPAHLDLQESIIRSLPERVIRRYLVVPLQLEKDLFVVATCDPFDLDAQTMLEFSSARPIRFELATPQALRDAIQSLFVSEQEIDSLISHFATPKDPSLSVRVIEPIGHAFRGAEDDSDSIRQLTSFGIREAIRLRATDIHVEPQQDSAVMRFRIDGVLRDILRVPLPLLNRVIGRLKVIGGMNSADPLRPDDGSVRVRVDGRIYDLRLSTIPTRGAQKAVIRILAPEGSKRLEDLHFSTIIIERVNRLLARRQGLVYVTGPTSSGKSTTLYAMLRTLDPLTQNIVTIEDPVEYEIPRTTQIEVNAAAGVTFSSVLRAILRQDPNVIMVGEIRDSETAEAAMQASMTGHLVLTSLHTNDAVGVIARMIDLGVSRAFVADTFAGAVAQRLVRKLCNCSVPITGPLTEDESRLRACYGIQPIMRAVGCDRCSRTGYYGRTPVAEVITATPRFVEAIHASQSSEQLRDIAVEEGMRTFQMAAFDRVRQGETTLAEIERAVGDVIGQQEPTKQLAQGDEYEPPPRPVLTFPATAQNASS